jgi:hypothetical protein
MATDKTYNAALSSLAKFQDRWESAAEEYVPALNAARKTSSIPAKDFWTVIRHALTGMKVRSISELITLAGADSHVRVGWPASG